MVKINGDIFNTHLENCLDFDNSFGLFFCYMKSSYLSVANWPKAPLKIGIDSLE